MYSGPSRQEIEERARANSVIVPKKLDKKEFAKFFDEATFKEIVQIFNSLDEEDKKRFYLDFVCQRDNTEYYQEQSKTDSLYNCSICKNTLETHYLDFYNDKMGHYFHHESKICKCNLIRKSLQLMKKNGLLKLIQKKSFDNFEATEPFQKAMKFKAVNFVKSILNNDNVSYFIGGQSGAGKTHICSAMLAELAKNGICVYFFNYIQDMATLNRYQYSTEKQEEFNSLIDLYKKADILYFDDFLYGDVSMSEQKIIFNIINHRYENDLSCIISSNKTMIDIKKISCPIYGRLYEMCGDYMININSDENKNYREKRRAV